MCAAAYSPSVELGCGLGGTMMLMLVLFLVYHVFWLELLLLYRSWFGTDERYTGTCDSGHVTTFQPVPIGRSGVPWFKIGRSLEHGGLLPSMYNRYATGPVYTGNMSRF